MTILYIPGFSVKNREETIINATALEIAGHAVVSVEWEHWNSPDAPWSLQNAMKTVKGLKVVPDIIVAKSIGTFVAVNLLKELSVSKIVLLGIPVLDLSEEDLKAYSILENIKDQTVLVHNINDNHGTLQDLSKYLELTEFDVHEIEADNHSYQYPELITAIINE